MRTIEANSQYTIKSCATYDLGNEFVDVLQDDLASRSPCSDLKTDQAIEHTRCEDVNRRAVDDDLVAGMFRQRLTCSIDHLTKCLVSITESLVV